MPYTKDGTVATKQDVLNSISQAFQGRPQAPIPGAGAATPPAAAAAPSAPAASPTPMTSPQMNMHMANMQQAAQDAKQKYMQENGVDENGDPVATTNSQ